MYPDRAGAERQAAAAHANGFQGDAACMPPLLHSKDKVRLTATETSMAPEAPKTDNPWQLAWWMQSK